MRLIHLYLAGYFVLMIGGLLALWQAGVLQRLSAVWVVIGGIIAVGLGIILAVSTTRTTTITHE